VHLFLFPIMLSRGAHVVLPLAHLIVRHGMYTTRDAPNDTPWVTIISGALVLKSE
jgi:hypothetical protein